SHSAVAWLRLRDRYGDMGLVCVGILREVDSTVWEIDTLLMSCRVMGRQVEDAFLAYLMEVAQERGAKTLRGVYIPTRKNEPVRDFFSARDFVVDGDTTNGATGTTYVRPLDGTAVWPPTIQRE